MTKKIIFIAGTLMYLTLTACHRSGGGSNPGTDSNTVSKITSTTDSNLVNKDSVIAMINAMQDTLNKIKQENTKLKAPPEKHPSVSFSQRSNFMNHIDWEWNTPNPPAQLRCLGYIITGDGAIKLRGAATAHDCVVNAIQAYRQDRLDGAINWLCAGQCHNDAAQQEIRNAGQMAAQYALQTYGAQVPE